LQPPDGSVGPYPSNYEAAVRDYVRESYWLRGMQIASITPPVPGVVTLEASGLPAAKGFGWLVRVTGVNHSRFLGLVPTTRDERHDFLLRDGKVWTVVLNGRETWSRGQRYAEPLPVAVFDGR